MMRSRTLKEYVSRLGDVAEPTNIVYMCLAIPGKIVNIISSTHAKVNFGGVFRNVNIELVKPKLGDYVVVHAGFAISVLNAKNAKDGLKLIEVQSYKIF